MTKVVLKWSKGLSMSLMGLALLIFLSIGLLLFTNTGLGTIVWSIEQFVPQLKIGGYQGALLPRFTLTDVQFNDPELGIEAQVNTATLAVNPACLSEPSLCVDDITVDGVRFAMPEIAQTNEPAETSAKAAKITTPIPIQVSRIALTDIDVNVFGHRIDWQSFTTGFSFHGNRLRIQKTVLDRPTLALAQSQPERVDSKSQNASEPAPIVLPDVDLPLQIEVSRLDVNEFEWKQAKPMIVHHLGLEAQATQSKVSVSTLELKMPEVEAHLSTEIHLRQDYPLQLELDATVKEQTAKGQRVSLSATGSVADLTLRASLDGLTKADIVAKLHPLEPSIPFDVELNEGEAQWPLHGQGDYYMKIDQLAASGSLKQYQVALKTAIQGKELPNLDLAIKGEGDLEQIGLSQVSIHTLGGSVNGDVMANWTQPVNWAANLSFSDIQPGLQWPDAEGDLSGVMSTTGSLTGAGGWQVAVDTLDVDGVLRGYPLNVEGAFSASDVEGQGNLKFDTAGLVLSHGPNSVLAKGTLTNQWRMDLSIDLPDLAKSVPELTGKAIGDVQLRGAVKEPRVNLSLDVDSIDWQQQAGIKHLTLQGEVMPFPAPSGNIQLNVTQAHYQDYVIDDAALTFDGTELSHKLTLAVESNIVSTELALTGSIKDKAELVWQGSLEQMTLSSQQGEWRLNQSTALGFEMASKQVSVASHCWLQADASLCLENSIKVGENGEASLALKQFDFSQVKSLLPNKTELNGMANAQIWAKWSANRSPELTVSLELPKGGITQSSEQTLALGWEMIRLNAKLKQDQLNADWLVDIRDNGDITGQVMVPNVLAEDKQIEGKLNLSTFNLDFLAPFIGEYSQFKSNVSADLLFSGPLLHPKLDGLFLVDNVLLQGDVSPLQVDSGLLKIDFDGYQAQLNSALNTPDGTLQLKGDAHWQELTNWSTQLRIFADGLKVEIPPMARFKVVPDMTISVAPKQAKIDGSISLPWGRVLVEELPPSAIGVSQDQVILNADLQPEGGMAEIPFDVQTNINISIGDDFQLMAFGLEGGLEGQLNVAQRDKGPFVTGEVNIVNGAYQSFGQDLVIKEGKILMNGPVDQPYVQITAIRNPENTQDDVTAGVKVSGPATEPTVTIFSDPAMPQANALSYLLRGRDIDGESGGNTMTTTLIGLSLAKTGRVVGEIGEAFGVQDLELDTAGSGNESQVTVSGYVLPGLQVKYGVGIFDSVGEFTVRYRLMTDLYLEAVTGLSSAVDLLYQFEFN